MIRKIELNVDKNGEISNSGDSFAGVSGETGATSVIFNVNEELLTAIKVQIANKTLYYRFEVTDALNRHFCLENNEVEENTTFSLPITNAFTVSEGKITISLIFESEGLTLCTLPVDLRIEKGCTGTPDNQQVYSTIVTLFEQAEKQIEIELEKSAERCEIAQTKADKILSEASAQAESIKADTVNTANSILSEMNSVCEKATADMDALLEESNTTLTECEQRKNAAEAAALSAIEAANSAAESKTQAEEMLSAKEDVANKETNLKQDVLPDHTKYASAKATQELVSALASSLCEQMYDANARLEGLKADRTELEAVKTELDAVEESLSKKPDTDQLNEIYHPLIKNTVTGKYLVIKDIQKGSVISEIKLLDSEFTDYSSSTLKVSGINLFDINKAILDSLAHISDNKIVFDYSKANSAVFVFSYWLDVTPNTDYTISCVHNSIKNLYLYEDKLYGKKIASFDFSSGTKVINSGERKKILLAFYSPFESRNVQATSEEISNIAINIGNAKQPYEEFKGFYEYKINTDGRVLNVPAVDTKTVLYTDSDAPEMSCEYSLDIKVYIDERLSKITYSANA